MPASMQSVTTRGFGLSGGFAGDAGLVVTLGYGLAEAEVEPGDPHASWLAEPGGRSWVAVKESTWLADPGGRVWKAGAE